MPDVATVISTNWRADDGAVEGLGRVRALPLDGRPLSLVPGTSTVSVASAAVCKTSEPVS